MCLIITKPEGVNFDTDFIKDVYNKNSDGLGVMYAENNVLYSAKVVPNKFEDVLNFWHEKIGNRACAIHFRMRTHGDTDLENCHPYRVLSADEGYPLYLIHNGILHTDNHKDKTKSDTWHYIQDYLRPMLLKNPTFFMTEAFKDLISDHIGTGNKFVLLDAYGNMVTLNEKQGVEHNGAWLSNTYAWNTKGTEHDWSYRPGGGRSFGRNKSFGFGFGAHDSYDESDYWGDVRAAKAANQTQEPKDEVVVWTPNNEEEKFADFFFELIENAYPRAAKVLTWAALEKYFLADEETAWGLANVIMYNQEQITDEDIIGEICSAVDAYEAAAIETEAAMLANDTDYRVH